MVHGSENVDGLVEEIAQKMLADPDWGPAWISSRYHLEVPQAQRLYYLAKDLINQWVDDVYPPQGHHLTTQEAKE